LQSYSLIAPLLGFAKESKSFDGHQRANGIKSHPKANSS
jgi:hypothetical protein